MREDRESQGIVEKTEQLNKVEYEENKSPFCFPLFYFQGRSGKKKGEGRMNIVLYVLLAYGLTALISYLLMAVVVGINGLMNRKKRPAGEPGSSGEPGEGEA